MHIRRRPLIASGILLAAHGALFAQTPDRVWRIGVLSTLPGPGEPTRIFIEALRALGYVEGRNLAIEYRWAAGKVDRLPELAKELVLLKVDVILAATGDAAIAAKRTTSSTPVVMVTVPDPVAMGLVASLARPGGNVTGTTNMSTDLAAKSLQLLREWFPKASRIAALVWKGAPATPLYLELLRAAAQVTGVTLVVQQENQPDALAAAFASMQQARAEALIVQVSPFTFEHRRQIVELAAQHRLAAMFAAREFVEAGGLISYGPSQLDLTRRAAYFVDRIIKGDKPADLPVEQPTRFEIVLNLKTAKALGITIPQSLLLRADEVKSSARTATKHSRLTRLGTRTS